MSSLEEPTPGASSVNTMHVHSAPIPDWNNLKVIHRNTLPPRSHFFLYANGEDALTRNVSRANAQLLSGKWRFRHFSSPFESPLDFHQQQYEALEKDSEWGWINVPSMWQLEGYGTGPQYTNLNFPFPVDPPRVPLDENECGRYVTVFYLSEEDKHHQLRLRFEGVDSAFTVWLNGHNIGYSQGSRNPSEFDITNSVHFDGQRNSLQVEVYQRCNGSYIEDQVCCPLCSRF